MDAREVAALLLLLLVATARSSDNCNGVIDASYVELPVLFPEDEFKEFHKCLGSFAECTAYVIVSVCNITVEGVGKDGFRTATDGPCRKYNCDSNIHDSNEGDISCNLQEKSEECNTNLEYQFLRDSSTSACVVLFLSNTTSRFRFDEQDVSDSCNASCSCEESATTTRADIVDVATKTVRPVSIDTKSTTRRTVAAATTTTIASTGLSIENVSSVNTTKESSASVNISSINDTLTKENTGSNATSLWKIILGLLVCVIVGGGVIAVIVSRRRRRRSVDPRSRNDDPQSSDANIWSQEHCKFEMGGVESSGSVKERRRSYGGNFEQDPESVVLLTNTTDEAERFNSTASNAEFPGATSTAEQTQSVETSIL